MVDDKSVFLDAKVFDYYDELVIIRKHIKSFRPIFPEDCCDESSSFCSYKLNFLEIGLRYGSDNLYHMINYDVDNDHFVDITLNQFSSKYPEIAIYKNLPKELRFDPYVLKAHEKVSRKPEFRSRMSMLIRTYEQEFDKK